MKRQRKQFKVGAQLAPTPSAVAWATPNPDHYPEGDIPEQTLERLKAIIDDPHTPEHVRIELSREHLERVNRKHEWLLHRDDADERSQSASATLSFAAISLYNVAGKRNKAQRESAAQQRKPWLSRAMDSVIAELVDGEGWREAWDRLLGYDEDSNPVRFREVDGVMEWDYKAEGTERSGDWTETAFKKFFQRRKSVMRT